MADAIFFGAVESEWGDVAGRDAIDRRQFVTDVQIGFSRRACGWIYAGQQAAEVEAVVGDHVHFRGVDRFCDGIDLACEGHDRSGCEGADGLARIVENCVVIRGDRPLAAVRPLNCEGIPAGHANDSCVKVVDGYFGVGGIVERELKHGSDRARYLPVGINSKRFAQVEFHAESIEVSVVDRKWLGESHHGHICGERAVDGVDRGRSLRGIDEADHGIGDGDCCADVRACWDRGEIDELMQAAKLREVDEFGLRENAYVRGAVIQRHAGYVELA